MRLYKLLALASFGLLAFGQFGHGQSANTPPAANPQSAPSAPASKFPDFGNLVKGAKVYEGLFTLHEKEDKLYAELTPQQLNKPYLLPIAVAQGAGIGGATLNFGEQWVILFQRVGDKIFLVRRNVRYTAKPNTPAARALATTYSDSILMALPIRALNPAKGSVVIDMNQIFHSDFAQLGSGYGLGMLDRERTTWNKIKTFKKNVELQVKATYTGRGGNRYNPFSGGDEVIDERGVTLVVHYGIVDMPESGYSPRMADDRVGHFLSVVKDFSKDDPDSAFVRYVTRWRLERADGSPWKDGAKLVPPKKKIVFWIENTVPDEFRGAVRDGILEWNKAFEKIGFRDAIEVRQQQDEEFDPEDISYATFRWITSERAYAIGPSRTNPFTGEILDADILFDASMVRSYKREQRLFRDDAGHLIEPASPIQAAERGWEVPLHPLALRGAPDGWADPNIPQVDPLPHGWNRSDAAGNGLCLCASHKASELGLVVAHLAANVGLKDGEPVPDELLQQAVKEVTMHEVGHTLGLRHNFKASTMLKNEDLHNTEITRERGLVGSVMDYAPANIAPKGKKQGDYFTTTLGPYDYWAIDYAYRPLSGGTEGELKELQKIAEKVATPELIYATDEDLSGTPDPLVNLWDLGSDPVKYAGDRIELAKGLIETMTDKVVAPGEGYQRVRQALGLALNQYGNGAYLASKQIGGFYMHRDHKGDPDGRDPLVPVPADQQRAALKFLQENILADKPYQFPPELMRKLGSDRWNHWGNNTGSVEFPLNERILNIQRVPLDTLLSSSTLSRIHNTPRYINGDEKPLTIAELMSTFTETIFPDGKEKPEASVTARNLQRVYVEKLAAIVLGKGGDVPADAKSLARLHLNRIGGRVEKLAKGEKDETQAAHLAELGLRIRKVLDASIVAN